MKPLFAIGEFLILFIVLKFAVRGDDKNNSKGNNRFISVIFYVQNHPKLIVFQLESRHYVDKASKRIMEIAE